jgi:dolichyl-phosphate-mannose-protein mannosyltransferase
MVNRGRRRGAGRPTAVVVDEASAGQAVSPAAPAEPAVVTAVDRPPSETPVLVVPIRPGPLAAVGSGLLALAVYLRTLEPSLPTGDSGELITAAYLFGVPHPPGYPLFSMLGHLFTLLPFGSVAQRVNLMSALLHALTAGLVGGVIYRLLVGAGPVRLAVSLRAALAATVGALLLAFSTAVWGYAVVAEVFPLNSFFAALLLLLLLEWAARPWRMRLLWLFGLCCGLAAANHHTIVLLAPSFLVLLGLGISRLLVRPLVPRDRSPRARLTALGVLPRGLPWHDFAIAAGCILVGLLPYFYLPLAASGDPPINWGDPRSWPNFVRHVTRQDYGTFSLATADSIGGDRWQHLIIIGEYFWNAFTPLGCVLALLGLWWLARNRPWQGLALLLAWLLAGPAFAVYANLSLTIALWKGVLERFYILPSVPFAVLAGLGAWQLASWVGRLLQRVPLRPARQLGSVVLVGLLLSGPVWALVDHFDDNDQSQNFVAVGFGQDILAPLERNALLLTRGDAVTISISYVKFVEQYRPDVVFVDVELLRLRTYVQSLRRRYPDLIIPFEAYDKEKTTYLKSMVEANMPQRPVYAFIGASKEADPFADLDTQKAGFALRLLPNGTVSDQWGLIRDKPDLFANLHYPPRSFPVTTFENNISNDYGRLAFDVGNVTRDAGRLDDAQRLYRQAILLVPAMPQPYKNLGLLLFRQNGDRAEVTQYWQKYFDLNPNDPDVPNMRLLLENPNYRLK